LTSVAVVVVVVVVCVFERVKRFFSGVDLSLFSINVASSSTVGAMQWLSYDGRGAIHFWWLPRLVVLSLERDLKLGDIG
jgi:hypothetical protein